VDDDDIIEDQHLPCGCTAEHGIQVGASRVHHDHVETLTEQGLMDIGLVTVDMWAIDHEDRTAAPHMTLTMDVHEAIIFIEQVSGALNELIHCQIPRAPKAVDDPLDELLD
jgi:hypothetical protein